MDRVEPEREMIRRALPFGPPAVVLALLAGAVLGGWDAGLSGAIGVVIVLANFVVHGWSLSRAARVSLTVLYAVGLGGFVVRLAAIAGIMLALDRLAFFSEILLLLAVLILVGGLVYRALAARLSTDGQGADRIYRRVTHAVTIRHIGSATMHNPRQQEMISLAFSNDEFARLFRRMNLAVVLN